MNRRIGALFIALCFLAIAATARAGDGCEPLSSVLPTPLTSRTSATSSAASPAPGVHLSVGFIEWMAPLAMRLRSTRTAIAPVVTPSDVHQLSDRLQVSRVDARPNAAQVVELQPFGDRTNQPLVQNSMRQLPSSIDVEPPISRMSVGSPYPTPGRIGPDLLHEASEGRYATALVSPPPFTSRRSACPVGGVRSHGPIIPQGNGCEQIPVTWWSPTGVMGCTLYGTGTASMWGGPGVARNDCVYPWDACVTIRITSIETLRSIDVTPVMYCDCYTGTSDERIVDLDPASVAALGLDASRGLWPVRVTPIREGASSGTLPDTATATP